LFCLGFILPAVLLIATGYVDCNAALAVFLITTAVGFSGISFAGWAVNHLDLAPQYAGQSRRIASLAAENTIRYDTRCYFYVFFILVTFLTFLFSKRFFYFLKNVDKVQSGKQINKKHF